MLCTLTNTGT